MNTVSSVIQGVAMVCLAFIAVTGVLFDSPEYLDFISAFYVFSAILAFLTTVSSRQRGGVDFLLNFFFLFFLAIPARLQIMMDLYPWYARLLPEYMVLGYAAMAVSQLCYLAGASFAERMPAPVRQEEGAGAPLFYTKWAWGIALTSLAFAAIAGPSNLFVARFDRAGGFGGVTQQALFICRSLSLLAMVMMIYLVRFTGNARLRRQNLVGMLLFILPFLVLNYVPALPRFFLFGTLIALSCGFINYKSPKAKALVTLLAVFILFAVFPFAKILASGEASVGDFLSRIGTSAPMAYMLRVDFDGFMQITSTIQYLLTVGEIRWGYNFFGVLLFFVPRGLWPGKPLDSGQTVADGLGFWYTNVSNPLPAEALMAFGAIGPIVVFSALGYIVSRIERASGLPGRAGSSASAFFLYSILMGFIIIIMRGALNAVAAQFSSAFLAFAIMQYCRIHQVVWRSKSA